MRDHRMDKKVSVCITTYNHEKFISQAIDSVLMQEVNFDYELIIGEDDSSDGTREIVKAYKVRYPDRIRLFLNDRENVIYINGRATGRWNFVNNIKHATGQYVALLEGDDYWTDPHKLQKQVEFLDSNQEFTICFHNVKVIYEKCDVQPHLFYIENPNQPFMQRKPKEITNISDLVKGNYIQTPSVLFRAGLFTEFPDWFYKLDRGDWPLHIINAQHGKIKYLDEVLAVYRVHSGGIYSSKDHIVQLSGAISASIEIDRHLRYKYHKEIWEYNTQRIRQSISLMMVRDGFSETLKFTLVYITKYGAISNLAIVIILQFIKVFLLEVYRVLIRKI